jgi:hypothetical protein
MPVGGTEPPKQWTAYICPTNSRLRKLAGATPRGRSCPTSSAKITPIWRRSNSHRIALAHLRVVPTTKRTFRVPTNKSCTPPSEIYFFPGKCEAYEGVGPPGWSVTAFHVPHRHGSTDPAELSTQPRPSGRPRSYPDTSGHPRTTTTPPHP